MSNMLGSAAPNGPIRLLAVPGYEGRVNDIIYHPPQTRSEEDSAVIYFGGDVQDYRENMEGHRDNKPYMKWSLDDTSERLSKRFPTCHVVVVRPVRSTTPKLATFMDFVSAEMDHNRMEFKTFSCYDNFVPCNNCGAPEHTPTHYTLQHLERLLQCASARLRNMSVSQLRPQAHKDISKPATDSASSNDVGSTSSSVCPNEGGTLEPKLPSDQKLEKDQEKIWWKEGIQLDRAHLILIGFSKGCVVLNQIIYEFHYLKTLTPDDDTMSKTVSRIRDMYWLDGGHSGGKNTWITSRSLLETLTRLSINIHVHVTPYQVNDDRRPWIRKEEKAFCDLLRRLNAPIERTYHFENQLPTLLTHFEVHNVFRPEGGCENNTSSSPPET
ncbi:UPF0565 protein C2orf69-like protein [Frankliniella fusca]|uniref:UPF0565 protein C2orf69-like protein n=1 Tax=Frankliniella fusca TaxID=407009 RepID=A0AAE1HN92_9NEOP|nr:UPF0565 protein C2orf69-like protein [Frankliniella fusca]